MAFHRELKRFAEIGFTEIEALQAANENATKSINPTDIGTIQEGKTADLVISAYSTSQGYEGGSPVNIRNNNMDNVLLYAGEEGLLEIVKLVVQAGA